MVSWHIPVFVEVGGLCDFRELSFCGHWEPNFSIEVSFTLQNSSAAIELNFVNFSDDA